MFLKNVYVDVTFSNKQLDNVTEIIFFLSCFFHLLILKQKGFFLLIYLLCHFGLRASKSVLMTEGVTLFYSQHRILLLV